MKDEVIDYDVGALDATTLQVLNEPGRPACQKSYAYCFRGGALGKEVVLYEYNAMEHKRFVNDWFAGFSGTLHCDADPFFNQLFSGDKVNASFCNAHARRKFEPIANATKGDGLAKVGMCFYRRIYRIERLAKDEKMTPSAALCSATAADQANNEGIQSVAGCEFTHSATQIPSGQSL
jgi:transposase